MEGLIIIMLLYNIKELIKGKYMIMINNLVVETGDQLKLNHLTKSLVIKEITSKNDITVLIAKGL